MKKTAAIVGGGITGLSAAYFLSKQKEISFALILLEKEEKLGGRIRTSFQDGFLIEEGPEAFRGGKSAAAELCKELGLENELLVWNPGNSGTFLLNRGKLESIPPHEVEKIFGSLFGVAVKKSNFLLTLRNGMETFPGRLAARLSARQIFCNAEIQEIKNTERGFSLVLKNQKIPADILLLTTPAYVSASMVENLDSNLAENLHSIPYGSSSIFTFGFLQENVFHPLQGSGFLVGSREGLRLKACTWSSSKWAGRALAGEVLLRAYVSEIPEDLEKTRRIVLKELKSILEIRGQPIFSSIHLHPRSMPRYQAGHPEKVKRIRKIASKYSGLFLAGAAYDGVGIPDCIRSAKSASEKMTALMIHR